VSRRERNGETFSGGTPSTKALDVDPRWVAYRQIEWNFGERLIVLLSNRSGGTLTMGIP
jgi:hypothetical protein